MKVFEWVSVEAWWNKFNGDILKVKYWGQETWSWKIERKWLIIDKMVPTLNRTSHISAVLTAKIDHKYWKSRVSSSSSYVSI